MQRKNSLLKSRKSTLIRNTKSGMAMIMAIAAIIIVATVMALSLALTAESSKRTNDLYLYEQSVLLSKSAAEYALLLISNNSPCSNINTSFVQNTFYTVDISAQYIYYDDPLTGVNEAQQLCTTNGGTLYTSVQTPEQSGSVVLDITVSVPQSVGATTEPIRYFRRTIQKL